MVNPHKFDNELGGGMSSVSKRDFLGIGRDLGLILMVFEKS